MDGSYAKKKKMIDLPCDDLYCDRTYLARGTWEQTVAGARSAGWKVYFGTLNSGDTVLWATCPDHAEGRRVVSPKVLEGQLELFNDQVMFTDEED